MGDNGASAEGTVHGTTNEIATAANGVTEDINYLLTQYDKIGGPETYNHYSYAWAHAMNTPFQWTKQVASHFGGTRNGMVISYPKAIKEKVGSARNSTMLLTSYLPFSMYVVYRPLRESTV